MTDICKCSCHTLNPPETRIISTTCFCCETCPKCYQPSVDDEHIEKCNVISIFNYKKKN